MINYNNPSKHEQNNLTNSHESFEQPFDKEICSLATSHLLALHESQRVQFRENKDALYKLNIHFPSVYDISKKIAPDDILAQTAALYHDYGRIPQLEMNGDFNDHIIGSNQDHHIIGYHAFLQDAPQIFTSNDTLPQLAINDSLKSGALRTIALVIKLHGLRGKAFDEEFSNLNERESQVVDLISQIDDIANGTQCVGYLLREGQEQKKNQSNGGFIPDENAHSKQVTPKVMELFRESTTFNRNTECKTYPDYYIFGALLATHNLKNPATRNITKELLSLPISIMEHGTIDGKDAIINKQFDNSIEAYKYTFDTTMEEKDAAQAYDILLSYFSLD